MKPALCIITIVIKLTMTFTQKYNNTEGINEILDKLIKQTENGSEYGVTFDKVNNTGNDSKIIYFQPNAKLNGRLNPFRRSINIGKERNNSDVSFSEEIIMEINDKTSGEQEDKHDVIENMDNVLNFNKDDQSDEFLENLIPAPNDPPEEVPELIIEQSINKRKFDNLIKDMVEPLKTSNGYDLQKIQSLIEDNSKIKQMLRQLFSTEDTGIGRSGAEYDERFGPLDNRRNVYNSFAHQMPLVQQAYGLGEAQQQLVQTLKNEAAMKLNYLQSVKAQESFNPLPVIPTFAPPSSNVIRTVIQHGPLIDFPTYVDGWRTGQPCCVS